MLRDIKYPGIPAQVVHHVLDETYYRCIMLCRDTLREYKAGSNQVYGELMPSLVDKIIDLTGLNEPSTFLDFGSGLGHVVMQLQTGCQGYGFELMPTVSAIATWKSELFLERCRMWGLKCGPFVLMEGDMTTNSLVPDELLGAAGVVLVNNKAFDATPNLKDGAYVVSLLPLSIHFNGPITERNFYDVGHFFDVTTYTSAKGEASWCHSEQKYYVCRVDHAGYHTKFRRFGQFRSRRSAQSQGCQWPGCLIS
ncbi:histone methylation protein DOT1-domain-containing protein [Mycena metata]|uniref:Histone-lysine N-methyltransferase, H3 lysine-79 specific n=1 Tax=Mycena metata TaxID=1033252 RepID=A0AAD7K4G3_9AGAR|nr:histone methylation protein DOT1-domain-containing protein [Mycena metata]